MARFQAIRTGRLPIHFFACIPGKTPRFSTRTWFTAPTSWFTTRTSWFCLFFVRLKAGKFRASRLLFSLLFSFIAFGPIRLFAAAPVLEANASLDAPATAGYFTLTWPMPEDVATPPDIIIEESRTADFAETRVVYRGPDEATTRSGLRNGDYFYRARFADEAGAWSAVVPVRVSHHSLSRALSFMGLGFAVFLSVAGIILFGWLREDRGGRS